jgi:hypothetical protein
MAAAKVGAWMAILGGCFRETEFSLENTDSVGTGDLGGLVSRERDTAMETVKEEFEVGVWRQEGFDQREVEDFFEHWDVIFDWVDDFNCQVSVFLGSDWGQIDLF